jgi:four helix bundle protein
LAENSVNAEELKQRTQEFSLRIIKLVSALPTGLVAQVLGRQVLKSGTSLGANYREALRATSRADFLAKIKIAEREIDETVYLIEASGLLPSRKLSALYAEARELSAIFAAIAKTTRRRAANCKL